MAKKKVFLGLAVSLLAVGALASCGPTDPSEPTTNPSEPSNSEPTTNVVPGETLNIEFYSTFSQDLHGQIQNYIDEFEQIILEEEGVSINFNFSKQGGYDEVADKIGKGFSTGIYPTMAVVYPDNVAGFIDRVPENVADISVYANDDKIGFGKDTIARLHDDYSLEEGYIQAFVEEGVNYAMEGMYSFPFLKSTEILAYDPNLVHSITIPSLNDGRQLNRRFMQNLTWDEFVTILEYIKANNEGEDGFNVRWPAYYDSDSNLFITKMMQNNIPFIKNAESPTEKVLFNNDAAKAEVQAIKDLHDNGLIMTKGANAQQYGSNYFQKSEIVFSISSSGGAGYMDLGGDVEVEVVKVPYDNNPAYVSQGPTVCILRHPNQEKDELKVQYAFRLLKYLTTAEINAALAVNSGGYVPVNTYAYDTDQYNHFLYSETNENNILSKNARCVLEQVNGAYYNLPSFKGSANIRDAVGGIITEVLTGIRTIDEAFERAESQSVLACK